MSSYGSYSNPTGPATPYRTTGRDVDPLGRTSYDRDWRPGDDFALPDEPAFDSTGSSEYWRPSRAREFLGRNARRLAALGAGVLLAAGAGLVVTHSGEDDKGPADTEVSADNTPTTLSEAEREQELRDEALVYPSYSLERVGLDHNQDPTFRASTVTIFGFTADHMQGYLGMGGLVERDGELGIQTIEHVTAGMDDYGINERYAYIPGVGTMELLPDSMPETDVEDTTDAIITISLTDAQKDYVSFMIDEGAIEPLTPTESESPQPGDRFVIPNPETGKLTEMVYVKPVSSEVSLGSLFGPTAVGEDMLVAAEYVDEGFFVDGMITVAEEEALKARLEGVDLQAVTADFCEGNSGTPILKAGTGNAVGSLSAGVNPVLVGGKQCSLLLSGQPEEQATNSLSEHSSVEAEHSGDEASHEAPDTTETQASEPEHDADGNDDKSSNPLPYAAGAALAAGGALVAAGVGAKRRRDRRRPHTPRRQRSYPLDDDPGLDTDDPYKGLRIP